MTKTRRVLLSHCPALPEEALGGKLMSRGLLFWILMILWLVFGFWAYWPSGGSYAPLGGSLLIFCLLTLLGWQAFGPPIKGG